MAQNVVELWQGYPWLGIYEETPTGNLKHMKSGTVFPGTYPFISSRTTWDSEGLTVIIRPTGPFLLDAPDYNYYVRYPLCQLDF